MTPLADRPIGVFDSGVGGLTVVRELWRRLPNERVVYFGDTARVPYGSKAPMTVRRYAREAAAFLLAHDVKLVVMACNTATAHAVDHLREELPVPVVGVVEPGARAAVTATASGRIGVLGTAGTIASGAYDREIRRLMPEARVFAQPCPLFVPLVEEGWTSHPATRIVAEEYLRPLRETDVDVLVLGCTHYPLLRPLLTEVAGPGTRLVDAAAETVNDVQGILSGRGTLRERTDEPDHAFFVSDSPHRFREVSQTFLGAPVANVTEIDLDAAADVLPETLSDPRRAGRPVQ